MSTLKTVSEHEHCMPGGKHQHTAFKPLCNALVLVEAEGVGGGGGEGLGGKDKMLCCARCCQV